MSKARDLASAHAGVTALAPNATVLNSVATRSAETKSGTVAFFAQTSAPTGWTAPTGTATRTSFDTATVTTAQLAERVKGLIDDLIAHGLIGA